jgi:hypothetical protein
MPGSVSLAREKSGLIASMRGSCASDRAHCQKRRIMSILEKSRRCRVGQGPLFNPLILPHTRCDVSASTVRGTNR